MQNVTTVKARNFDEILAEYTDRLEKGQSVYARKFKEIREARQYFNQEMPNSARGIADNNGIYKGNDNDATDNATTITRSSYTVPLMFAACEKIIQDLVTSNARYECEGNTPEGHIARKMMEKELKKIWTYSNNKVAQVNSYWHAVVSGTQITQIITKKEWKKLINSKMMNNKGEFSVESIPLGRMIELVTYDPLNVIIDWNANQNNIRKTSEFAIVTIGKMHKDALLRKYPNIKDKITFGYQEFDILKRELEVEAGIDASVNDTDFAIVREYYTKDGFRYVIVGDSIVAEASPNSNGSFDCIPINVAPIFFDPDSIYGMTLYKILYPTVDILSSTVNQVLDMNALNRKMPIFAFRDAFPQRENGICLDDFDENEIVFVDNINFTGSNRMDLTGMFYKPQFPEITNGAQWVHQQALQFFFYITGLNPATLGGIQEKQIRNEAVANIIQGSSLRNSSKIVVNLENCFMNPTTWDILNIMNVYYDDFPSFAEAGVTRELLLNLKNLRVINGSYLPGDQQVRENRLSQALALGQANPNAMNWTALIEEILDLLSLNPEEFLVDPMQMLTPEAAAQLFQMIEQGNIDQLKQYLLQTAQAGQPQ